jgi:hypothetical protein
VFSVADSAFIRWVLGPEAPEAHTVVQFEPVRDKPGELVGAAERGSHWLAQWRSGGRSWLVLHDSEGSPVSGAMEFDMEGDLLSGRGSMLTLLQWEGAVPAEMIEVKADLEWRRAE